MDREREIRERVGRATPGPWMVNAGGFHPMREVGAPLGETGNQSIALCRAISVEGRGGGEKDAEFIAMAREDIPFLLSLIDEQRQALEAVDAYFEACATRGAKTPMKAGEVWTLVKRAREERE